MMPRSTHLFKFNPARRWQAWTWLGDGLLGLRLGLCCAFLLLAIFWQQSTNANTSNAIAFGQYHALVVGINDYKNLRPLETAVNDASAVADLLRQKYGFSVTLLLNPSRDHIIRALEKYRAELTIDDNLLIYYAGHGVIDRETDTGFWLPVDAEEASQTQWIDTPFLTRTVRAITARHILIVSDSCYSGKLVRDTSAALKTGEQRDQLIRRLNAKVSRTAMVSGGVEPVSDGGGDGHSIFARSFLTALRENKEIIEGSGLFNKMRYRIVANADQTPEYASIHKAGDEGGDFLFVPKTLPQAPQTANTQTPAQRQPAQNSAAAQQQMEMLFWQSIQNSRNAKDFESYLAQFPNGVFVGLAKNRLGELTSTKEKQAKPPQKTAAVTVLPKKTVPPQPVRDSRWIAEGVEDYLRQFRRGHRPTHQPRISSAPVRAGEKNGETTLAIPDLLIGRRRGPHLAIGDVQASIGKADKGQYPFQAALPNRWQIRDSAADAGCEVSWRTGSWAGNWMDAIAAFSQLRIDLNRGSLQCPNYDVLSFERLSLASDFSAQDTNNATAGPWNGGTRIDLHNLTVNAENRRNGELKVQELQAQLHYKDLPLPARKRRIAALEHPYWQGLFPTTALGFDHALSRRQNEWLHHALPAELEFTLRGGTLRVEGDSLSGDAEGRIEAAMRSANAIDLGLTLHWEADIDIEEGDLLPPTGEVVVMLQGLNIANLTPREFELLLGNPLQLLQRAEGLELEHLRFAGDGVEITATGILHAADPSRTVPLTGALEIEIQNIEELALALADADPDIEMYYVEALLQTLYSIPSVGNRDRLNFQIDAPEGRPIQVNGVPLLDIINAFQETLINME